LQALWPNFVGFSYFIDLTKFLIHENKNLMLLCGPHGVAFR